MSTHAQSTRWKRNGAISNGVFSIPGGGDRPGGPGRRGGRWPGHRIGQFVRRWRWYGGGAASGQKVDVIIRATDSAYWQTLLAGAEAAATDFGVTVGTFGPTSETDIAGQVQLVENSVSRGVDAIVIAPSSSEALNASIDAARKAGIKVITADTKVTADIEGHIGTNNKLAGAQAGQHMCDLLTAAGKTTGKVLVEAPIAGIEANQDRDAGFRAGLAEKCPISIRRCRATTTTISAPRHRR